MIDIKQIRRAIAEKGSWWARDAEGKKIEIIGIDYSNGRLWGVSGIQYNMWQPDGKIIKTMIPLVEEVCDLTGEWQEPQTIEGWVNVYDKRCSVFWNHTKEIALNLRVEYEGYIETLHISYAPGDDHIKILEKVK